MKYRYRIRNTGYSSKRFGLCEVCGKHASEVFSQIEEVHCKGEGRDEKDFWSQWDCTNLWGHKQCLVSKRRKPYKLQEANNDR